MLFSKAQQKVMNLAAEVLSEVKNQHEKYKAQGCGEDCGFEEREVVYILNDVAMRVKITIDTVTVVKE
jgi:hypothetical protein